jgi:hypothetical protein
MTLSQLLSQSLSSILFIASPVQPIIFSVCSCSANGSAMVVLWAERADISVQNVLPNNILALEMMERGETLLQGQEILFLSRVGVYYLSIYIYIIQKFHEISETTDSMKRNFRVISVISFTLILVDFWKFQKFGQCSLKSETCLKTA